MQWKVTQLVTCFPTTFRERLSAPHIKSGKRYLGWWVRTASHPFLSEWRAQWYKPKKVVPRALVKAHLDRFALAVWFCDDGHRNKNGSLIYTMAFSASDVRWLISLLWSRFGLRCGIAFNKKGQPFIRLNKEMAFRLDDIVKPYALPGMTYKYTPGMPVPKKTGPSPPAPSAIPAGPPERNAVTLRCYGVTA